MGRNIQFKLMIVLTVICGALDAKLKINRVVIWGDKLHSHTHSYIHQAFYKTFKYLGYETYWLDNQDNINHINFSNTLFITEWQADERMPIRDDCYYAVHNIKMPRNGFISPRIDRYQSLIETGRCINFRPTHNMIPNDAIEVEPATHYCFSTETLYMPWATDLLPYEIDVVKKEIKSKKRSNIIHLVGTHYPEINEFKLEAEKNGIQFQFHSGKSIEENKRLIQESYMAPAIITDLQQTIDYLPCRLFKNISYGQMGITNSRATNRLFDNKLIFAEDKKALFYLAKQRINHLNHEELFKLMDIVKDKHTYINRIERLLEFIEMNFEQKKLGKS